MIAEQKLKNIVDSIATLQDEIKERRDEMSAVYKEAKSEGFDTKILKAVMKRREMTEDEIAEQESLIETYEKALAEKDA